MLKNLSHHKFSCSNVIAIAKLSVTKPNFDQVSDDDEIELGESKEEIYQVNFIDDIEVLEFYPPTSTSLPKNSKSGLPEFMSGYLDNDDQILLKLRTTVKGGIFGGGWREQLLITFRYLFTAYKKDPPHEPSGELQAARVYPVVEVDLVGADYPYFATTEYDLDHALDLPVANATIASQGQVAGVFSDKDIFTKIEAGAGIVEAALRFNKARKKKKGTEFVVDALRGEEVARQAFEVSEKPILKPIAGTGVERSDYGVSKGAWDNIHFWSKAVPISTPGAFFCIHMHWRWGSVTHKGNVMGETLKDQFGMQSGEPQFDGRQFDHFLIDPNHLKHLVSFMIYPTSEDSLEKPLSELIDSHSPSPEALKPSDNLSIRYRQSIGDVFSSNIGGLFSPESNPEGIVNPGDHLGDHIIPTFDHSAPKEFFVEFERKPARFFLHGFYFAHENEPKRDSIKELMNLGIDNFVGLGTKEDLYLPEERKQRKGLY